MEVVAAKCKIAVETLEASEKLPMQVVKGVIKSFIAFCADRSLEK